MSLELLKEAVRVNQVIGEEKTQTIVENDIIVPDSKPDIVRILLVDGDTFVNSTEAAQDKVLVNGTIRYKILYISDDLEQQVKSINSSAGFNYALDIPNTRQGMKCRVKCDIEHIEYDVLNSRKVNIKSIVSIGGKTVNQMEQNIVRGFEGIEGIQVLKSSTGVNSYLGSNEISCPVRETMEIPAGKPTIREILRNDVKITGKDYKLTDDKIIVKGDLNVSTLYIGDDENRSIHFMEHEMPFTQFVDLPGISEDAICEVDYNIADLSFEADEDNDGELRLLKGEVMLDIFVNGFTRKDIELVDDAYSTDSRLTLEKEPCELEEFVAENKSQVILKETVFIDDDSPDIAEVFNVLSKPSISDYRIVDDRIFVEGVLDSSILYLANNAEQPVFCCQREIPFRHGIDIKGVKPEMSCNTDLNIEHCSYSMVSTKEVEIRFVITAVARIINQIVLPVISKVNELPPDEKRSANQPSITIYFIQQGDTLWKIAKRYLTTIDEIKKINDINENNAVNVGEQIIIPRKLK